MPLTRGGNRVVVPLLTAAPRSPLGRPASLQGLTMGVTWSVQLYAEGRLDEAALHQGVQARLDQVVAQMSNWDASSHLSRFARLEEGDWLDLPDLFYTVMAEALDVAAISDGAFDPSAGALVDLWGFGPAGRRANPPPADQIAASLARGGWRRLELDRTARRLRQPGGAALDLSGIAKGFGVDHVAAFLDDVGVESYLIEVGGELRGAGVKGDGTPWWVTLEEPAEDCAPPRTVTALIDLSIATSGDYRRYFDHEGRRYSHTLDPRTGRPLENGIASVSVLHPRCMSADALATAIGVLGWNAGAALAEDHGVICRIVRRTAQGLEERLSPALQALLD